MAAYGPYDGISAFANGSVVGAGLPILAMVFNLDPAVIAGPLITTIGRDGLIIYF